MSTAASSNGKTPGFGPEDAGSTPAAAAMTLRIPRELRSPNAWMWKHWRIKQRERAMWERDIFAVGCVEVGTGRMLARQRAVDGGMIPAGRHRVTVTRRVPSRRNFIRDDDNLRFSVKPLNDALKRAGLIYSDAREWLEQPMPTQEVGPGYETVIVIEAIP